jgi:hypothetical protein
MKIKDLVIYLSQTGTAPLKTLASSRNTTQAEILTTLPITDCRSGIIKDVAASTSKTVPSPLSSTF